MSTRPSLGFDDDEDIVETAAKADLVDLSGFQPKPVARPDSRTIAEAAYKARFKSREAKTPAAIDASSAPTRQVRRHRTGRSAQLNLKVRPDTIEQFYAVADAQGWILGEAFEKAVALLEEQYGKKA